MNDSSEGKRLHDLLLSEHRELSKHISDLREWWLQRDEIGEPNFLEMSSRIRKLSELLEAHFRHEEQGGYLKVAITAAPRFAEDAEELKLQHAEFLDSIEKFAKKLAYASREQLSWQQVGSEFEEFIERLKKHEAKETKILQSAFADDLGTGD